ncbi:MAG: 3-hydroxyacyl-CoA dehydrogenase/enoyl-CoA hydratase family protein [Chloroflexota bacterium]
MSERIRRAVVVGAGTMGAALAAHLANAGVPTTLLDIVPNSLTPEEQAAGLTLNDRKVRNRIVSQGLERALKSRPASFFCSDTAGLVRVGNLEDDFEAVAKADWIIEAIVENLEIKRSLMQRIDEVRGQTAIVSTNTSGIPVGSIAEGRSESFRQHFLGTHFFNPPRYLKLLEVIPTPDTLPSVVESICTFGERRLGKGTVICKDTPNFIANRLGTVGGAYAMDFILEHGYTVAEVDAITGPVIGRPKTATFRLLDLVGLDVMDHVMHNLAQALPKDEAIPYLKSERALALSKAMIERGWLGNKANQGYYKEVRQDGKKEYWQLNLKTLEYEPPEKVRFESVGKVKDLPTPAERFKGLLAADDRAGQLVRALTYHGLAYASKRIPEIADTPRPIDNAMRWGFMHEAGPFETWDALGVAETVEAMKAAGHPPARWVEEMLAEGHNTFYQYRSGKQVGAYNPTLHEYEPLLPDPNRIVLGDLKAEGRKIESNDGASLIDLGHGVICLEFHTKANALDDDILRLMDVTLNRLETQFEGLVIGNEGEFFCAGANLFSIVVGAQNGMWDMLDQAIRALQTLGLRMRYSPKPVVVAPFGMSLGGGCEITMSASRVVAAAESYIGLVEVGAGVIPAGGGCKEVLRRLVNPAIRAGASDALPFLQKAFEMVGQAKVATSAEEARQMGFLTPADRVVMNRDHLLAEAKREVLHMAPLYRPPVPERVYAAGRDAYAAMLVGVHMFREGGYISEYDAHIGRKLAYVLAGGELSQPTWVEEGYILDLEREAFLSLCGEQKTQERMWSLLQTGKPLRN